jgi:hypothetical protein
MAFVYGRAGRLTVKNGGFRPGQAPPARPILKLLAGIPSALQFVFDNDCSHIGELGFTAAVHASVVCAMAFGKEEGEDSGDFHFTQTMIDGALVNMKNIFSGSMADFTPVLPTFFLRPVLMLCISDSNKTMLVQSSGLLVQLLLDTLFQGDDHPRKALDEPYRACIQLDGAECFLQLALFGPGRELLERHPAAVDAIRALSGTALTAEAKQKASSALLAIEGRPEAGPANADHGKPKPAGGHLMMSYCWNVQPTIKRVVASLKRRGYAVWFDLEQMRGSTMDAMADAVDNAECMLICVSEAYKESGNCRLEASYAHQVSVDMIPLMMQEGYTPKAWLGLIMGTRLWYPFFESSVDTDTKFERQMDALTREIVDRGKPKAATAANVAPPPASPSLDLAMPARAALESPAAAVTSSFDSDFTPSLQNLMMTTTPTQHGGGGGGGGGLGPSSLGELAAFVGSIRAHDDKLRQEARAERAALEVAVAELRTEAVSTDQLATLQARVEGLHGAALLSDDELSTLEDLILDASDLRQSMAPEIITPQMVNAVGGGRAPVFAAVQRVHRLVLASQTFRSDAGFARQLRRRWLGSGEGGGGV